MDDRGRLAAGQRADVLLVEAPADRFPRAVATILAGRLAYPGKDSTGSLG